MIHQYNEPRIDNIIYDTTGNFDESESIHQT